jgi:uncharacterized protein
VPDSIDIQIADHTFTLFAERALYWPAQSMLFVADTHFGKEATFRRGGIPVPDGVTDATLEKIGRMLERTQASRFFILGDMFHARSSIAPVVRASLERFFTGFSKVDITLVRGNHDARVGALPKSWPIKVVDPGLMIDRVALGHHPGQIPSGADVYLCGHLHPAIRVSSRRESLGKMPCFWHSHGQLVLPAIGEFTGTHVVHLSDGESAWITAENMIFACASG